MDDSVSRVLTGLIPRLFRFAQLRKKKSSYSRTMIPMSLLPLTNHPVFCLCRQPIPVRLKFHPISRPPFSNTHIR